MADISSLPTPNDEGSRNVWGEGINTAITNVNTELGTKASQTELTDATAGIPLILLEGEGVPANTPQGTPVFYYAQTNVYADDTFNRTVADGWGDAHIGGTWTSLDPSDIWSVSNGAGRTTQTAGGRTTTQLDGVSQENVELFGTWSLDTPAWSAGTYCELQGRVRGDKVNFYSGGMLLSNTGNLDLRVQSKTGGPMSATTILTNYTAGRLVSMRVQIKSVDASSTQVSARCWYDGDLEPTTWQVTSLDTVQTNLQGISGGVGFEFYTRQGETTTTEQALYNFRAEELSA